MKFVFLYIPPDSFFREKETRLFEEASDQIGSTRADAIKRNIYLVTDSMAWDQMFPLTAEKIDKICMICEITDEQVKQIIGDIFREIGRRKERICAYVSRGEDYDY